MTSWWFRTTSATAKRRIPSQSLRDCSRTFEAMELERSKIKSKPESMPNSFFASLQEFMAVKASGVVVVPNKQQQRRGGAVLCEPVDVPLPTPLHQPQRGRLGHPNGGNSVLGRQVVQLCNHKGVQVRTEYSRLLKCIMSGRYPNVLRWRRRFLAGSLSRWACKRASRRGSLLLKC